LATLEYIQEIAMFDTIQFAFLQYFTCHTIQITKTLMALLYLCAALPPFLSNWFWFGVQHQQAIS